MATEKNDHLEIWNNKTQISHRQLVVGEVDLDQVAQAAPLGRQAAGQGVAVLRGGAGVMMAQWGWGAGVKGGGEAGAAHPGTPEGQGRVCGMPGHGNRGVTMVRLGGCKRAWEVSQGSPQHD